MTLSQNVTFAGAARPDPEYDHPPGAGLARDLLVGLRRRGLEASGFDTWRDVGWVVPVGGDDNRVEIAFASIDESTWLLQIIPAEHAGPRSRFRRAAGDQSDALYAVARIVSDVLLELDFSHFRWRVDGKPREGDPTTPVPPST